jgi:hypothetical protein
MAAPARKSGIDAVGCSLDVFCSIGASCAVALELAARSTATASETRSSPVFARPPRGVAHPLLNRASGTSTTAARIRAGRKNARRRVSMLETIAIILIILWLLGMVSGYTLGNFIYVLLVIAIVLFLVRLISGRTV